MKYPAFCSVLLSVDFDHGTLHDGGTARFGIQGALSLEREGGAVHGDILALDVDGILRVHINAAAVNGHLFSGAVNDERILIAGFEDDLLLRLYGDRAVLRIDDDLVFALIVMDGDLLILIIQQNACIFCGFDLDFIFVFFFADGNEISNEDSVYVKLDGGTLKVGNTAGAALPSAGGQGTKLITLLGCFLTLFAAGMLISRRRV